MPPHITNPSGGGQQQQQQQQQTVHQMRTISPSSSPETTTMKRPTGAPPLPRARANSFGNNKPPKPSFPPARPPPSPRSLQKKSAAYLSAPDSPESVKSTQSNSSLRSAHSTSQQSAEFQRIHEALDKAIHGHGPNHPSTGAVYNRLGNWFFRHQQYNDACHAYQQASLCNVVSTTSIPATPTSTVVADALANLGTVYWTTGELDKAKKMLQQSLSTYELDLVAVKARAFVRGTSPNTILLSMANVHHQLGLVYSLESQFGKALKCLEHAKTIRQQAARPELVSKTLDAMGQVSCLMQDYTAALAYYASALTLPTKTKALTLQNMAWIYGVKGDAAGALAVYQDLLQEQRSVYRRHPNKPTAIQLAKVYIVIESLNKELQRVEAAQRIHQNLQELAQVEQLQPQEVGLEQF